MSLTASDQWVNFLGLGIPVEGSLEHVGEPLARRIMRRPHQRLGPEFGLSRDEGIVQQGQGLCRNVGDVPPSGGDLGFRLVEGRQQLGGLHDRHLEIDGPPPVAVERSGEEALGRILHLAVGIDGFAEEAPVQTPRDGQQRIANRLGIQALQGHVMPEPVGGVRLDRRGAGLPDCLKVSLKTIVRTRCFTDQPFRTKSSAR